MKDQDDWKEEFVSRFTDGVDKENGYYDSSFEEGRPSRVMDFISNLLSSQARELNEQRCARCNGPFIGPQHRHITKDGPFHTNCYKVNNLGYERGAREMKERMKACVPKIMPTGYHGYRKFNDCREQTLSALEKL